MSDIKPFFAWVDIDILVSPRAARKSKERKKPQAPVSAKQNTPMPHNGNLQGPIETILKVIQAIGPAHARDIEQHPEVVKACRSSKTKARRHIERLCALGHVRSDGSAQMPKFAVKE